MFFHKSLQMHSVISNARRFACYNRKCDSVQPVEGESCNALHSPQSLPASGKMATSSHMTSSPPQDASLASSKTTKRTPSAESGKRAGTSQERAALAEAESRATFLAQYLGHVPVQEASGTNVVQHAMNLSVLVTFGAHRSEA